MSMTRPTTTALTAVAFALTLSSSVARAATSLEDKQTMDMMAAIFCGLSWIMMLGLTGYKIYSCLNYNPTDRFFQTPAQPESSGTHQILSAKQR